MRVSPKRHLEVAPARTNVKRRPLRSRRNLATADSGAPSDDRFQACLERPPGRGGGARYRRPRVHLERRSQGRPQAPPDLDPGRSQGCPNEPRPERQRPQDRRPPLIRPEPQVEAGLPTDDGVVTAPLAGTEAVPATASSSSLSRGSAPRPVRISRASATASVVAGSGGRISWARAIASRA